MNADRLFALYDRVADAPDAVDRLRRFVLDLSVRGKLVEQDPADEPASELLKRIAAEKARLLKAREIRKPGVFAPLDENGFPFSLPTGWEWAQIAQLGVVSPRNEAPDDHKASFVPMRLISAEYGAGHQHETRPWADIRKGYTHFAEGDVGLAKITPCFENGKSTVFRNLTGGVGSGTTELHVVRPLFVTADYIVLFLKCSHFIETGILRMTGTAGQKRVPTEYFTSSPFPLPPLAEQRRIVAKVDELMVLCDRLEETRNAREDTRDRLSRASLARLTATDTDARTFRSHAQFAVNAVPALTARADQVKLLRQTILSLAVRGKLAAQDPQEGSGRDVHARITSAHPSSQRSESGLKAIDGMYPLPSSWTWASLGQAIVAGPRNGLSPRPSAREDAPRAVTLTATTSGIFDGSHFKRVDADIGPDSDYWLQPNDLLFQRGNTPEYVGMAAIYDGPPGAFIFPDLMIRVRLSPEVNLRFAHIFCLSPAARSYFSENATGAQKTMPKINQAILRALPIPLPPLAEQHRIVAKVDAVMALCERMEAGLAATDGTRSHLLDSLLHESLGSHEAHDQREG
ncbi:restriction endonuclease subunit S [Candidatus Palauibacter sp.]|uniref:restriction endonuclease subunit S n=1 Tax=Candidatus Palauibacter sp. TaxID=3101350 RepID=UPI003C7024C4